MNTDALRLFHWVRTNTELFDFKSFERRWIPAVFPEIHDVVVAGRLKPRTRGYYGSGSGTSRLEAYIKAVAEVLERELMVKYGIRNSNGCAVHPVVVEAVRRARMEQLERDAFLCHFLTGTPFDPLPDVKLRVLGRPFSDFQSRLKRRGFRFRFFRMRAAAEVFAIVAVANPIKARYGRGVHLGYGCAQDLDRAISQATIECMRTIDWNLAEGRKETPLTIAQFNRRYKKRKRGWLSDHSRLCKNPRYARRLEALLFSGIKAPSGVGQTFLRIADIRVRRYRPAIAKLPLHFVHSDDSRLQKIYWGGLRRSVVNRSRLRLFLGVPKQTRLSLTEMPHPFA